jgi:hypothetical protein
VKLFNRKPARTLVPKLLAPSSDMENNEVILWSQRWLIDFIDAFLMRWCQFSLMIGCILGTFGLYATSFNLTAQPVFNGIWAGIQAVSIDGLFFAVWSVWRRSEGKGWLRTWYFFIGVLLMAVAAMVNGVVSFTELHKVATISLAMQELHIDESAFSWSRSVLVVLVAVLITTLPRGAKAEQTQAGNTTTDMQELVEQFKSITVELVKETVERQIATITFPQIEAPSAEVSQTQQVVQHESDTLDTESEIKAVIDDVGSIQGVVFEGDNGRRYGSNYSIQIENLYKDDPSITPAQVAKMAGCSATTAKKWLARVKPA